MYRDEVGRVLRLGDLEDEDGDSNNNEGGERKGGSTTPPSTAKNATRKDKNQSVTITAAKKNKKKKRPVLPCQVVVSAHRSDRLLRLFECEDVGSDEFTSFECRVYNDPKPRWQYNGGGASCPRPRWVLLRLRLQ